MRRWRLVDVQTQLSRPSGDMNSNSGATINELLCTPKASMEQTPLATAVVRPVCSCNGLDLQKRLHRHGASMTKADKVGLIVLSLNIQEPLPKRDPAQWLFKRGSKTE